MNFREQKDRDRSNDDGRHTQAAVAETLHKRPPRMGPTAAPIISIAGVPASARAVGSSFESTPNAKVWVKIITAAKRTAGAA